MTKTCFGLPQGGFFCLSRWALSRSTLSSLPKDSGRIQHFKDIRIDLIHCILNCFGHWILALLNAAYGGPPQGGGFNRAKI
jgi:hypothetical protein